MSFALVLGLFPALTAWAQGIPLQASEAQVGDDGDLQYFLTNTASQPATAWSVTVTMSDGNGSVLLHSAIMTDEYRAEALHGRVPDEELDASLLRPHRPRRFVMHGPFDVRTQLTVTPAAIVFLDRSFVGDPQIIDRIFGRRAAERDARHDILRQLRDVQARCTGVSALKEAISRLSRPADTDPGNTHQIVHDLHEALTRVETDGVDPTKALADQIEVVQLEYRAAVEHAAARREK
jgi:hypothetical protein